MQLLRQQSPTSIGFFAPCIVNKLGSKKYAGMMLGQLKIISGDWFEIMAIFMDLKNSGVFVRSVNRDNEGAAGG